MAMLLSSYSSGIQMYVCWGGLPITPLIFIILGSYVHQTGFELTSRVTLSSRVLGYQECTPAPPPQLTF